MKQLNAALDRLQTALAGLDSAAEARLARSEGGTDADVVIEQLRSERNELAAELEQVRAEAAALDQASEEVSGRLDGAIAGIKEVLEG